MHIIILVVLCIFPWIYTCSQHNIRNEVIYLAESQIGVIEKTENWGPEIKIYLDSCGFNKPVPWCACYISWIYKCLQLNTPRFSARAASWTELNQYKNKYDAISGDVFTIYYSELGRVGHAGIIDAIDSDYIYSIEGNTGGKSGKDWEGDRVMKKLRPWTTIYKTANWIGDYYHTVQPGENLYRISLKYNISVETLKKVNNIDTLIKVNQKLYIPNGKDNI